MFFSYTDEQQITVKYLLSNPKNFFDGDYKCRNNKMQLSLYYNPLTKEALESYELIPIDSKLTPSEMELNKIYLYLGQTNSSLTPKLIYSIKDPADGTIFSEPVVNDRINLLQLTEESLSHFKTTELLAEFRSKEFLYELKTSILNQLLKQYRKSIRLAADSVTDFDESFNLINLVKCCDLNPSLTNFIKNVLINRFFELVTYFNHYNSIFLCAQGISSYTNYCNQALSNSGSSAAIIILQEFWADDVDKIKFSTDLPKDYNLMQGTVYLELNSNNKIIYHTKAFGETILNGEIAFKDKSKEKYIIEAFFSKVTPEETKKFMREHAATDLAYKLLNMKVLPPRLTFNVLFHPILSVKSYRNKHLPMFQAQSLLSLFPDQDFNKINYDDNSELFNQILAVFGISRLNKEDSEYYITRFFGKTSYNELCNINSNIALELVLAIVDVETAVCSRTPVVQLHGMDRIPNVIKEYAINYLLNFLQQISLPLELLNFNPTLLDKIKSSCVYKRPHPEKLNKTINLPVEGYWDDPLDDDFIKIKLSTELTKIRQNKETLRGGAFDPKFLLELQKDILDDIVTTSRQGYKTIGSYPIPQPDAWEGKAQLLIFINYIEKIANETENNVALPLLNLILPQGFNNSFLSLLNSTKKFNERGGALQRLPLPKSTSADYLLSFSDQTTNKINMAWTEALKYYIDIYNIIPSMEFLEHLQLFLNNCQDYELKRQQLLQQLECLSLTLPQQQEARFKCVNRP